MYIVGNLKWFYGYNNYDYNNDYNNYDYNNYSYYNHKIIEITIKMVQVTIILWLYFETTILFMATCGRFLSYNEFFKHVNWLQNREDLRPIVNQKAWKIDLM